VTTLSLQYRCDDRHQPLYLRHAIVEQLAREVRHQLVGSERDAIPLSVLREITDLDINGLRFELWVDLEHPVRDEHGHTVFGLCEFDPGAGVDAAILSVSPAGTDMTEELVLSTFAHELGHGVFDAPGWISRSRLPPDLFDAPSERVCKAYRTTTRDAEHLHRCRADAEREATIRFAELRANEFMGSLLVPREGLLRSTRALAPLFDARLVQASSLFGEPLPGPARLAEPDDPGVEDLQKALAKRFGVHRRFIEVRMERYGLLPAQGKSA